MGSKHNIPAVVTSLNINGLAVVRTLGRHGVPVIGIHNNDSDPEAKSRFLTKTWLSDPADLIQTLLKRAGDLAGPKPVLVPITDDAVTAIAQNLTALRELYTVPMPDPELVLQLLDKRGFDRIAQEMGLPVPQTWYVRSRDEMNAVGPDITFPCILKPQEKTPAYFAAGGLKAYVFEDLGALLSTYESFCAAEPRVVVQQYIPGGDDEVHFCLQACAEDHSAVYSFPGNKLRQWRPHCGGTSACAPIENEQLVTMTADFFQRIGMSGPCSMEFKRDPGDGSFYMIEPTVCRTDWQNAVADANGVPVIYGAYCVALGLVPPAVPARARRRRRWVYFSYDRLSADYYIQRRELGRLAWLWSIRPPIRGAYFALDDWGPFLATCSLTFRRVLAKFAKLSKLPLLRPTR